MRRARPATQHQKQLAIFQHDRWRHRRQRALARTDRIRRALDQPVHVRHARLGGEVVHLIVQQKAQPFGGDARSEGVVQRCGNRNRIAGRIHHRVVRRVLRLAHAGCDAGCNVGVAAPVRENRRPPQIFADAGVRRIDRLAPAAAYCLSISCATGILAKSGSPRNSARSKNARRKASTVR